MRGRANCIAFFVLTVVNLIPINVCHALYNDISHRVAQSISDNGAATYEVPISVPPGRGNIAPNLILSYNSYRKNSWVGIGWSLEMGAIQRSASHGVDYNSDDYVLSINGATSELKRIDQTNDYVEKIENRFSGDVPILLT